MFHASADSAQAGGLRVADGHHEVGADEHVQFAELDGLLDIAVVGRAQHHEQRVAVALDFRALVPRERVFHGERVQVKLGGDGLELVLARAIQADPGEPAVLPHQLIRLIEAGRSLDASTGDVDAVVDQCHRADPSVNMPPEVTETSEGIPRDSTPVRYRVNAHAPANHTRRDLLY